MSTASIPLRQLSGLPAAPARLSESALVIVDAQNAYRSGVMQLEGVEPALDECARLLARARALKIPVVHIQHDAGPGSPYDPSAECGAIADKVAPVAGEVVVVKHYPNSFVGTELDERLKAAGVKNLVVVGFMTHMCINSTARGAFNLSAPDGKYELEVVTRDGVIARRPLEVKGSTVDLGAIDLAAPAEDPAGEETP